MTASAHSPAALAFLATPFVEGKLHLLLEDAVQRLEACGFSRYAGPQGLALLDTPMGKQKVLSYILDAGTGGAQLRLTVRWHLGTTDPTGRSRGEIELRSIQMDEPLLAFNQLWSQISIPGAARTDDGLADLQAHFDALFTVLDAGALELALAHFAELADSALQA